MSRQPHPCITPPSGLPIYYRGPEPDQKALPGMFYFALSAEESLFADPYNQPCVFLKGKPVRVFSSTLPCHGKGFKNTEAIALWVQEGCSGNDIIGAFVKKCCRNLDFLMERGYIDENRIAAAGLSRGGFIATHVAAKHPGISHVLGYAPMTTLAALDESQDVLTHPLVSSWALEHQIPHLIHKKVRYYIGNVDTRVGTHNCFDFVQKLAYHAREHQVRSPSVEMIMTPSVGRKGHGTPPQIFKAGIDWLADEWGLHNESY